MTNITSANRASPAPASQTHGSALHKVAPFRRAGRSVVTQSTYTAVGKRSGRTIVRRIRGIPSSTGEHLGQAYQHSRRRPPDVPVLVRQDKKDPRPLLEYACHSPMVARVENKRKRHLEHLGHFKGVRNERKGYSDDADHRGNLEAGPSHISIE